MMDPFCGLHLSGTAVLSSENSFNLDSLSSMIQIYYGLSLSARNLNFCSNTNNKSKVTSQGQACGLLSGLLCSQGLSSVVK